MTVHINSFRFICYDNAMQHKILMSELSNELVKLHASNKQILSSIVYTVSVAGAQCAEVSLQMFWFL